MGGKRGYSSIEVIIAFTIGLFVLFLIIYLVSDSNRTFIDSLTCSEQGDSGLIQVPSREGCKAADHRQNYLWGFFGRDPGMACCEITNYDEDDPSTWQMKDRRVPEEIANQYSVGGVKATSTLTGKEFTEGQTVVTYAGSGAQAADVRLSGSVRCPKDDAACAITCKETLLTAAGTPAPAGMLISPLCPNGILATTVAGSSKGFTGDVQIKPDPAYADQVLTYTLALSKGEDTLDTYTLRFKVASPVKIAGLSQSWSKRKEVIAACESPIVCSEILFKILPKPAQGAAVPSCPTIEPNVDAQPLTVSYCILKDGRPDGMCHETLDACTRAILDQNDAPYAGAYQAIMAAVRQGLIPENVAMQFAQQQGQKSTFSCVKSVGQASDPEGLYSVATDPTTKRATFTLEHKAFEDSYVCVYGRTGAGSDAGPAQRTTYTAKGPTRLMLDVTPPTAILDFRPGSLQLRLACQDNSSGCKSGFGIAYIGQVGDFLRALAARDTPQNAAAWCPPYATSGAYRSETRAITQYNENEVRVLCLRVEDQAGNAGVAMATVYNAYDLLVNAIALAIQESED